MASNQVTKAQPDFFVDETNSYLYNELWKLCAGPLFDLPKFGEKVYYFPQGHIEQLEASTNDELAQMKPLFDLPSKIRCNVIDIQLKVENKTNEIYAQVTLLPDTVELGIPIPDSNQESLKFYSFAKVLSASDTSTHGSMSVLRKHAIECLPSLDMSHPTPTQEIVAKDLLGYEWKFKHSFRGTPRRHLFTTGWSAFVTAKNWSLGTVLYSLGENGELGVGIRRATHQRGNIPSSVISTQSMFHGIIASALNAINNKCMFVVFYKPRSSQFVPSFDKFLDAVNNKFNVGSRFTMQFEGTDFIQIRYSGTIIGVQDFSPHWKDSEWQSLVVQWDEAASIPRPDKVSPWEIEKLPPSSSVPQSYLLKNKRLRQVDEIGSNLWTPTLTQGQEIGQSSMNAPMSVPHLSYNDATDDSKIPSGFLMSYSVPPMSKPNYNDQMVLPMKEKITTNATISYRLFGVDMTIPKVGPIDSYQNSKIYKVSEEKKLDQTHTLTSPKTIQSKQINFTRSRTKVQMQGVAIGRVVDLTVLDGYNELIGELEKLFDLKDELHTRNQWEIVFTDDERDMMLVGDDPWPEFCNKVKKILICSKEKVKKMKSGNKFSESDSALTTTI